MQESRAAAKGRKVEDLFVGRSYPGDAGGRRDQILKDTLREAAGTAIQRSRIPDGRRRGSAMYLLDLDEAIPVYDARIVWHLGQVTVSRRSAR